MTEYGWDESGYPATEAYSEGAQSEEAGLDLGGLLHAAGTVATGMGLMPLEIQGSVGSGGQNLPDDVAAVQSRLYFLGYEPGQDMDSLISAIARYQSEVVGLRPPDGRIDVGGRTIHALAGGSPAAHQAAPSHAGGESPPAPAPTGELGELVSAANNPAVDAAAAKLAELQRLYASDAEGHFKGSGGTEMSGADRDALVSDIGALRGMVAGFGPSGVPADQLPGLEAAFYRAIDLVAPYFFQGNNVMLEYHTGKHGVTKANVDLWNTCNITSLAMCLQALGLTADAYEYRDDLGAIIEHFHHDLGYAEDVTSSGLSGMRLPDILGMAAVYENLANKTSPSADQIDAAGNAAMGWVPNIFHVKILASRFGVNGETGSYHHDDLAAYGKDHWKAASAIADARARGEHVSDDGLSTAAIEHEVPLQKFRDDILAVIGPALDSGKQVVAGQFNHFVRIESVNEHSVIKDDPGNWLRSGAQLTWEEVRALGLFENYLILG